MFAVEAMIIIMPDDPLLQDRLYINDGKGNFTKSIDALPVMNTSKQLRRVADVNGEAFLIYLLAAGLFRAVILKLRKAICLSMMVKAILKMILCIGSCSTKNIGMVTDAAWIDLNNDNKKDLIVVGEWMPVTVFININGNLENKTKDYFDKDYSGWWNKLLVKDLNNDGKPDLVIGNLGLNSQCRVSDKEPADIYYKDFDNNGTIDPILCFYIQHKSYPYVTRDEMIDADNHDACLDLPTYKSYADATLKDIFTEDELKDAKHLQVNDLSTSLF